MVPSCWVKDRLPPVVATVSLQLMLVGPVVAQDLRATSPDVLAVVRPTRRAPDAPPKPAPELPTGAQQLTPLTLHVVIAQTAGGGRALTERQTVSRTTTQVHIAMSGREWLFERNPVDPRRVSGMLGRPCPSHHRAARRK